MLKHRVVHLNSLDCLDRITDQVDIAIIDIHTQKHQALQKEHQERPMELHSQAQVLAFITSLSARGILTIAMLPEHVDRGTLEWASHCDFCVAVKGTQYALDASIFEMPTMLRRQKASFKASSTSTGSTSINSALLEQHGLLTKILESPSDLDAFISVFSEIPRHVIAQIVTCFSIYDQYDITENYHLLARIETDYFCKLVLKKEREGIYANP